jgi:leader peptidase (prepilin peptidase) / N-methyltransferase
VVVVAFVLGLAFGAVINALADDLPPDELGLKRPLRPPHCAYCGATYAPRFWLALGHWVLQRGSCQQCGASRRGRHAVVELLLGLCLAGLWVWAEGKWSAFLPAAVLAFIFALISIIDIEHRLVLWRVVLPAAVVIALMQSVTHGAGKTLLGGLAGYGLVMGMFLLGQLFSSGLALLRGRPIDEVAFGSGDVNLAALVGLAVGWPEILLVLMVTIFSGGAFALGYLVVQAVRRRYNPYTAIPYGPFFVLGAAVIYLFGRDFAAWYIAQR